MFVHAGHGKRALVISQPTRIHEPHVYDGVNPFPGNIS